MTKTVKNLAIDFFQVQIHTGAPPFEEVLGHVGNFPDDESRNFTFPDYPVRLNDLRPINKLWAGDITKIRLHDPAFIASVEGKVAPITMDENREGLGETTAFLYDPQLQVILVQRNRYGISAQKVAFYFGEKAQLPNPIGFFPVITAAGLERLRKMQQVKKFQVKVAQLGIINPEQLRSTSLEGAVEMARDFESPIIDFTLSIGRSKGISLNLRKVMDAVRSLLRTRDQYGESVASLVVSGQGEDDEPSVVNFLEDKLVEKVQIEPSSLPKEFYQRRLDCLLAAWDKNRKHLTAYVRGA